jgi:hypothetical protein
MLFLRWLAVLVIYGSLLGTVYARFIDKSRPIALMQPVFVTQVRSIERPQDRHEDPDALPAIQSHLLIALLHAAAQ